VVASVFAASARVYDLETGAISVLQYKNAWHRGRGTIKGTLKTGQAVEGEFVTVPSSSIGRGSIYSSGG